MTVLLGLLHSVCELGWFAWCVALAGLGRLAKCVCVCVCVCVLADAVAGLGLQTLPLLWCGQFVYCVCTRACFGWLCPAGLAAGHCACGLALLAC